jgi:hypothetical protein
MKESTTEVNPNIGMMDAEDGHRSFQITNKKTCHTWEREEPRPGEHIRLEEVQTFLKAFLFLVFSAH